LLLYGELFGSIISISPHSGFNARRGFSREGSVTGKGSFLSRFTLKFLEVFAAGLATAVSGFLLAHFAGFFAAPNPAAAVKQPVAIERGVQSRTQAAVQGPVQVKPSAPAPAAPEPVAPVVNAAPAAPPQANAADQPVAATVRETRPRDPPKGAAAPSFEARMRAALAKAAPADPPSSDAPRRETVAPIDAMPRANAVAPQPADTPTGSIASAPRPADRAPPNTASVPSPAAAPPPLPQAPPTQNPSAQTSTIPLAPPPAIEIKSQPIASVDANQPAQVETAPSADQGSLFSGITKRLRSNAPLPDDQAPRPPMPVGQ
jgi:hypothetical protein